MTDSKRAWPIWGLVSVVILAVSLTGCGSGGSGTTADTDGGTGASTGSVALLLTDKPIDLDTVSEINATIAKAELIAGDDDDDHRVTIFSGPPTTKNLLALRNGSVPLAFSETVPVGTYCKIRLTLDELEVVFADPARDPAYPHLPGNGKLDLVVQGCFDVIPGATVQLMADLDMEKSLLLVEAGRSGRINFRPVAFIKVLTEDFTGRLVRLHGEIKVDMEDDGNEVLLCQALPMHRDDDDDHDDDDDYDAGDDDRKGCVALNIDRGSTALFNNLGPYQGEAIAVANILRADGLPATAVGKLVLNPESPHDFEIPDGHLPPPGACKIWYPHRPDGQQPPPAACEDLEDEVPPGAVLIDHYGEVEIDHRPYLALDALVIELGEFIEELAGTVASGASEIRFTMDVDPGQVIATDDPLQVQLQQDDPTEGINGTKILTKEGDELTYEVLTPDRRVMVDGVLIDDGDPLFLRSALVIVEDLADDTQRLSGTVTRVAGDGSSFLVVTDEPACGHMDVVVDTDDDTKGFTVTVTDSTATSSEGISLEIDDVVDVYGRCQLDGSFAAETIIEIDDQRT